MVFPSFCFSISFTFSFFHPFSTLPHVLVSCLLYVPITPSLHFIDWVCLPFVPNQLPYYFQASFFSFFSSFFPFDITTDAWDGTGMWGNRKRGGGMAWSVGNIYLSIQ
ncbi:hypothetical protein L873DRAFT_1109552 [Choiromyces venosus 120613-1]|uniref:Uncharacterized protein n=1 Tax=Choiromyces venosus 120613-1 TaxID=1336337 RepID=A0A3N4JGW4_9PEZI|nr:hypothetical protein L873DRAFT_1109552 [Choiromyces venosus 120613-1]